MPARSDDGFRRLQELGAFLQALDNDGEEVRIVGTNIITKSGRLGWSTDGKWVTHKFPKRVKKAD